MGSRYFSFFFVLLSSFLFVEAASQSDLVQYVNTLQGTHSNFGLSHGNTFPATAMPYGQHMWTPQTGPNGEGFKYLYSTVFLWVGTIFFEFFCRKRGAHSASPGILPVYI